MNWLTLTFVAFQSFLLSTIVRLDGKFNCPFSRQRVSNRNINTFRSHGPTQLYAGLPDSRLNDGSVSFGGCQQQNSIGTSILESFRLFGLIQSFVVPQNLKPKNNNNNNCARARQMTMTSRDVLQFRAFDWQANCPQALEQPQRWARTSNEQPPGSGKQQATSSHVH